MVAEYLHQSRGSADIMALAEHLEKMRRILPDDPLTLSAEMIILQEGLDLLVAYRNIPDRTTRLLIKALVEEISPKSDIDRDLETAAVVVSRSAN